MCKRMMLLLSKTEHPPSLGESLFWTHGVPTPGQDLEKGDEQTLVDVGGISTRVEVAVLESLQPSARRDLG